MKNKNEYMPLGSIVRLNNFPHPFMICGKLIERKNQNKIYDYCACLYPEGILSEQENLRYFNRNEITEVLFTGQQNDLDKTFNNYLSEISKLSDLSKLDEQKLEFSAPISSDEDTKIIYEMKECISKLEGLKTALFADTDVSDIKKDVQSRYLSLARSLFSEEKIDVILELGQMDFISYDFINYAEIQKQIDNYGFQPSAYVIIQDDDLQLKTMRNYLRDNSYKFVDPVISNNKDYVFIIDSTNKVATYALSGKILENSELPVKSLSKFLHEVEKQKKPLSERLKLASEKLNMNKSEDKQAPSKSYEKTL